MRYIKSFSEITQHDAAIAGGKGVPLGEMTRLFGGQAQGHNPIPPGFVVLAGAFDQFLAETDLGVEIAAILDTVKTDEMHTVEYAAEKIQSLILSARMPQDIADEVMVAYHQLNYSSTSLRGATLGERRSNPVAFSAGLPRSGQSTGARNDKYGEEFFVAVRSSATAEDSSSAAWAGQLESFLNTTRENLLANVQKCWASLYTPRAIFYAFEKGFYVAGQGLRMKDQGYLSVAVVIQVMVQSEVSGIAFSVHPVTQDKNQLIIEAGYGLGEAIVSGQITPDSYVVTKNSLEIIDKNISAQEKMLVRAANGGNEWVNVVHGSRIATNDTNSPSVIPDSASEPASAGNPESMPLNSGSCVVAWDDNANSQQKLSDSQILELSRLIIKIENHYGFPCDIEWACIAGPEPSRRAQFYITQSRPITTITNKEEPSVKVPVSWQNAFIVDTKIATQVLHDGDLVEVDADNGVVRILKRSDE